MIFQRFYAEGDLGAPRSSGSDSFNKREKANEDYYVREHEKAKLQQMRKEIARKEQELSSLKKDAQDLHDKASRS